MAALFVMEQIECCGIDTTCDSMCYFYRQLFILEAWILLEYYGFTVLFQGNYYMYFQNRQGMHLCGVTCEQSVNVSQEQNAKTCLGWFSFSSPTVSSVTEQCHHLQLRHLFTLAPPVQVKRILYYFSKLGIVLNN